MVRKLDMCDSDSNTKQNTEKKNSIKKVDVEVTVTVF